VVEFLFMGLAILRDRGRVPVFPRWSGWLCIVTAILTLPAAAVILTKTGPWRWSGFFGWWVPAIAFGVWFMAMTVTMLRPPRPAAS
jgi:hypothetical protein